MHVRNAAWCRTTPIVLVCLLKGKATATVVSTSDWIEKALLVQDPAHTTLATDKMQSGVLIKQFFRFFMLMVNICGHKALCYLGYTVFC